ncbi:MAG: hypothetical protein QME64_00450 [bacterium]|nr:hypothetical protein [bacterium]
MKLSKKLKHEAVYWLLLGLKWLVKSTPFTIAKKIASCLAILGYYLVAKNRNRTLTNLKNIYSSQLTGPQLTALAKATYIHWAKCVIELLSLEKFSQAQLEHLVRIEGLEYIEQAKNQNQGIVCVLAHYGNWELLGAYFAKVYKENISVVANELYDKKIDKLLNVLRANVGLTILPPGNAVKSSLEALRKNQVLAIMADYDGGGETLNLPFLESTIQFPVASLFFAYRSGAPVVPAFIMRQPDDTHCVYFEPPLVRGNQLEPKADFQHFVTQFVGLIETYIRREPTQWAWME